MTLSRRDFLGRSGRYLLGAAAGLASASRTSSSAAVQTRPSGTAAQAGFGPLRKDPDNLLDLPKGFSYRIISMAGDRMTDGFVVPGLADGMTASPGPNGATILVCSHEFRSGHPDDLGPFGGNKRLWETLDKRFIYDWRPDGTPCLGSVTTIVYDTRKKKLRSRHLSLAGTMTNCSGGLTPWGTYLCSEEVFEGPGSCCSGKHGYTFEVAVSAEPKLTVPVPLTAMGRFSKEGVAVDPRSGIVYQTEDLKDGLFYRFLPASPGRLAEGGRLQAFAVAGSPGFETNNWRSRKFEPGRVFEAAWVDLDEPDPEEDVLRLRGRAKGAATFASGEGAVHHDGAISFVCTNGGTGAKGQIWRYVPGPEEGSSRESDEPGRLTLVAEPNDPQVLDHPDQIVFARWGDLFICEDGDGDNFVLGVTKDGVFYKFARLAMEGAEPTGVCFSPDGTTMFLNDLTAGLTFAVTGPWKKTV